MLNKIKALITYIFEDKTRKNEEEYLAQSYDLVDLERRQRALMNKNLDHWI